MPAFFLIAALTFLTAVSPTARIEYKLPKTTTLGEPAIMTVTLWNTTGFRITADFGVDDQTAFVFRHTRPDGRNVKVQPALTPPNRMRTSRLMLRGNVRTAVVVLDEWLDLSQVGPHQIDVEYTGSVEIEGGNPAAVARTARLLIEVKPRDAARLEKRAKDWLKQVSQMTQSSEARVAAAALTVMTDPVVIPYLELAAARTRAQRYIDALVRMNNADASGALHRLAQNPDPEVRALALKALKKTEEREIRQRPWVFAELSSAPAISRRIPSDS